jgi:hypothetical protein
LKTLSDPFALLNLEIEEEEQQTSPSEYEIEAYQIVRLTKSPSGSHGKMIRTLVDTMYVEYGNGDAIKRRAMHRAQVIGNCMVIEKCEKVIGSYFEPENKSNDGEDDEL